MYRLTDHLEGSKVNDAIDFILLKNGIYCSGIVQVRGIVLNRMTGYFLYAGVTLRRGITVIIYRDGCPIRLLQDFNDGMTADVSGSACNENIHGVKIVLVDGCWVLVEGFFTHTSTAPGTRLKLCGSL